MHIIDLKSIPFVGSPKKVENLTTGILVALNGISEGGLK